MAHTGTVEGKVLQVIEGRRQGANLTQTALSDLTDIPLATLNRYLRGSVSLPFRHLESIATALGTTPATITAEAEAA